MSTEKINRREFLGQVASLCAAAKNAPEILRSIYFPIPELPDKISLAEAGELYISSLYRAQTPVYVSNTHPGWQQESVAANRNAAFWMRTASHVEAALSETTPEQLAQLKAWLVTTHQARANMIAEQLSAPPSAVKQLRKIEQEISDAFNQLAPSDTPAEELLKNWRERFKDHVQIRDSAEPTQDSAADVQKPPAETGRHQMSSYPDHTRRRDCDSLREAMDRVQNRGWPDRTH